jgi:hypothetical protein
LQSGQKNRDGILDQEIFRVTKNHLGTGDHDLKSKALGCNREKIKETDNLRRTVCLENLAGMTMR